MVPFVHNDGGREKAGYKGSAGDCGIRALAIATGVDYETVAETLREFSASERTRKSKRTGKARAKSSMHGGIYMPTFQRMLEVMAERHGFEYEWNATMGIGTGCKVHLHPKEMPSGRIIARVSRHYTTMIDGVLHDTYDCSRDGTRCVYGYWRIWKP